MKTMNLFHLQCSKCVSIKVHSLVIVVYINVLDMNFGKIVKHSE